MEKVENMNYIVKQIQIPESEKEYPNLYGWGGAEEKSPAWKAKLETMHFSEEDTFDITFMVGVELRRNHQLGKQSSKLCTSVKKILST